MSQSATANTVGNNAPPDSDADEPVAGVGLFDPRPTQPGPEDVFPEVGDPVQPESESPASGDSQSRPSSHSRSNPVVLGLADPRDDLTDSRVPANL